MVVARCYWSFCAAHESGDEWDDWMIEGEFRRVPVLLAQRLGQAELASAEAEGRALSEEAGVALARSLLDSLG